jgi:excisionase family DNA binding protein
VTTTSLAKRAAAAVSDFEPLVDALMVGEVLDTSARHVQRLAKSGQIPYYRVGARNLRFRLSEVLEALRQAPT